MKNPELCITFGRFKFISKRLSAALYLDEGFRKETSFAWIIM